MLCGVPLFYFDCNHVCNRFLRPKHAGILIPARFGLCIKSHARVAAFYENCNKLQFSILYALRRGAERERIRDISTINLEKYLTSLPQTAILM